MRKLAREAVIFALLGWLVATIGIFVVLDIDNRTAAKGKAVEAVHANTITLDFSKSIPIQEPPPASSSSEWKEVVSEAPAQVHTVQVPLRNGTVLQVRQCPTPLFDMTKAQPIQGVPAGVIPEPVPQNCRNFSDPFEKFGGRSDGPIVSVPLGNADQVAIEKEYWTAYHNSRSLADSILPSLFGGVYGFPAGLGLWIFYRLVRFAVKG